MFFTEGGDQLRPHCSFPLSTLHATSLSLAQQAVVRDPWSPPVVGRSLPHPSVRAEHPPINLTRTPFDVLSWALDCASALGRNCRLHTLHSLMAARQTSIAPATAPPAPAFVMNVEIGSVASTTPVVAPLTRLNQYLSTITPSPALADRASPQMKPTKAPLFSCVPRCSKSTGHSDKASLSKTFVSRSLGFSFASPNVICSRDRAIAAFCVDEQHGTCGCRQLKHATLSTACDSGTRLQTLNRRQSCQILHALRVCRHSGTSWRPLAAYSGTQE